MRPLFLALALLAALPARAAETPAPRDPTIDDLMRLRMVLGFEPVPKGNGAVVQVQEYDGGTRFLRDLWHVVPGAEPRRLTVGGRSGGSFALSPDGRRVAFVGDRGGKSGIHALPLDGGEATLMAELPMPAENLRWVGDRVYFTAPVLPVCGTDLACTKKALDERAKGPSALVYTELYHRPWNAWSDGTRTALFALDPAKGTWAAVVSGPFNVLRLPFGGREDYDVAADGAIVYTAKKVKDIALSTNDDLYLVAGGVETRLTDNPGSDHAPAFSPDGRFVAYQSQGTDGFESDLVRLKLYDRTTGKHVALAPELDDWVVEMAWAPDSRSLVVTVEQQGHRLLYRVEAKAGAPARALGGRFTWRHPAFGADGRLWATRETLVEPPDLWTVDGRGREARVTDLNRAAVAALRMPKVQETWWDGAEVSPGKRQKVHGFLVMPPDAGPGRRYPFVMMIHGGPQGSWLNGFHSRWNALGVAGHGFVVALPNPTGSTGYGQAFVNAVSKDWGGKAYQDLMALLDHAATVPGIDAARSCAMGGSFGGYMANWMQASTDRFRCLISHAGPSDIAGMYGTTDELWFPEWDVGGTPWENPENYERWSPIRRAGSFRTPMLVIQGANDFRVPLEQALAMFTALKRRGIESKLVVFPDEDHFISRPQNRKFWYDTVVAWLGKHLQPGEAK